MGRLLLADGSSSLLLANGIDHLLLSAESDVVVPYVNNSVSYYTPRHERIGRPLPPPIPQLPQISAKVSSGQGGQSVSARFDFSLKGNGKSRSATAQSDLGAEFSIGSQAFIKQFQDARSGLHIRITASVRAVQMSPVVSGSASGTLTGVAKTGGEALVVPTYDGEEAFFESVDAE